MTTDQGFVTESVHNKSNGTANGVALRRTFTDIPLCKEIYQAHLDLTSGGPASQPREDDKLTSLIPFFEARYLLTNKLLAQSGVKQIFELAAGLTPRSLLFGANDPLARCVEFDLANNTESKKLVVDRLVELKQITCPTNVWFESGNVTDIVALATASRHFRNQPIAIINEGLDRYLSQFERGLKLDNIVRLLKHFGGVHITPDIVTKTGLAAVRRIGTVMTGFNGREARMEVELGFKMTEHYYIDVEEALRFYESHGLRVEVHNLTEVLDQLTSPQHLGLDLDVVEKMIHHMVAFSASCD